MKITVRKEHIENAKRKDSHHCMIADAIRDCTNGQYIRVDVQSIQFSDVKSGERFIYLTPPIAQNAIIRWDKGIEVQPFSFEIHDPKIKKVRTRWTGNVEARNAAQRKYEKKRRLARKKAKKDPNAPRLVTKKSKKAISRYREFGLRKYVE